VPQTPLRELIALSRPPSWIWGSASRQGRGWAGVEEGKGEGKGRGGKGRAPKLLLNQEGLGFKILSQPCYATAHNCGKC